MKEKLSQIWKKLEPLHGIIFFVIILVCCHFLWKFTVIGDESNDEVTFFGLDISAPFIAMTDWLAQSVTYILKNWLNIDLIKQGNIIAFSNRHSILIYWGCSGLKQMYIFTCLIAFSRGAWMQKLWYIPAGLLLVHLFNIFRITVISYAVAKHIGDIDFLHNHLFKYLFYGFIFLMWVFWEEKFGKKPEKDSNPVDY